MEITKLKDYVEFNLAVFIGPFTVGLFYGGKQEVSFKGYKEHIGSPIDDVMQQIDTYIGSCCTKIVSGARDGLDGYDVRIHGRVEKVLYSDELPGGEE